MEPLPDFSELSNPELDRLIEDLIEREATLSFERRTLQARLDILVAEREARRVGRSPRAVDLHRLAGVLARTGPAEGWREWPSL